MYLEDGADSCVPQVSFQRIILHVTQAAEYLQTFADSYPHGFRTEHLNT